MLRKRRPEGSRESSLWDGCIVNGNCNLFLCLVSLDPSEITIILFTAQETFLIIISVEILIFCYIVNVISDQFIAFFLNK